MSPHRDEHLELCAGYVLDALDDSERHALRSHLAEGCAVCDAELGRLATGVHVLAASLPRHRAPRAVRQRVRAAIRAESAGAGLAGARDARMRPPRARRLFAPDWVWAAAAVLMAAAGLFEWRLAMRAERDLAAARGEIDRLRREVLAEREWAEIAATPGARFVRLEPTPAGSPGPSARVIYDPSTRRALATFAEITAPAGKDYQLWAIGASGPLSLGLVRADSSGRAALRLSGVGAADPPVAFAVSLENAGGAPTTRAPAGPVVMVGNVGG